MSDSNRENDDGPTNGLNIGNDILEALLSISAQVTQHEQNSENNSDNLDSLDSIGGEYSTLNNTIDELNKFMDRWEERHDRLREQIHEVLAEDSLDELDGDEEGEEEQEEEGESNTETVTAAEEGEKTKVDGGSGSSSSSSDNKEQPPTPTSTEEEGSTSPTSPIDGSKSSPEGELGSHEENKSS